jgi:hypothetical protein
VARTVNSRGRFGGWALALLVGAGAAAAAEAPQKPRIDAFVAGSGLPRSWVVSVKPEIVVAIRDRDSLKPGEGAQKVRLQGEAADEEMAGRLGYRSMRSLVEINCETRRDRVMEMEVFAQHDLKGAAQKRPVPGGWIQPSEDAYLADVIRAACRAPKPPQAQTATEVPQLRPAVSATARTAPRPTPSPAPARSDSASSGPTRADPAPRLMAVVATAVASAPPAAAGHTQAQIGALNSAADARRALDKLAPGLPGGLSTRVEVATVGGRTYYRAMIAGFAAPAQAQAFCAEQRRRGGPCLTR